MDDRDRVAAIRAHDPRGLTSTYETYASALYTFCRSMLRDEHAAQDAVHDTFIILDERVGQLRDPSRLRPWLYAIARSQCLRHLRSVQRATPTDDLGDVMDPNADITADLETTQLQTLLWDALAGLNPGERAALEMSLRHGLSGADLADALGVSPANAKKLLQRGKDDLEKGLGALLLTRAPTDCTQLVDLTAGWDGQLTPLMRKRLGRHIESCAVCGERKRREVNAPALLATLPLLAVPVALTRRVQHTLRLVSDDTRLDQRRSRETSAAADRVPSNRERHAIARRAGPFDRAGFPIAGGRVRRNIATIIPAAAALVVAVLVIASAATAHQDAARDLFTITAHPRTAIVSPSNPASPSLSQIQRPPTTTSRKSAQPTNGAPTRDAASQSHRHTTAVATKARVPTSAAKPTPSQTSGVLELSSTKIDLGPGDSGDIQLTAKGAPVTWAATPPPGLSVKPIGGTLAGTLSVAIVLNRTMFAKAGTSTVEFSWSTGKVLLSVSWADGP